MSVRAVAVRGVSPAWLLVVRRTLAPHRWSPRPRLWARLVDDRDLIWVKVLMITVLLFIVMASEVPW